MREKRKHAHTKITARYRPDSILNLNKTIE